MNLYCVFKEYENKPPNKSNSYPKNEEKHLFKQKTDFFQFGSNKQKNNSNKQILFQ